MTRIPCSDDPVEVSNLNSAIAVSTNWYQSMALLSNHTVETWGANFAGELGDGTAKSGFSNLDSDVPVPVCTVGHVGPCPNPSDYLTGVKAISAGGQTGIALLNSETAVDWGSNEYGVLGIGTTAGPETCEGGSCTDVPVEVSTLTGVSAVSGGSQGIGPFTLALLNDGNVMAWGYNGGHLGNGSMAPESDLPVAVCAVDHVGTCSNPSEYLSGTTTISTDGDTDSVAIAELGECTPDTAQWYSDGKLICEPVSVSTKGKLTLDVRGGESMVSCKLTDSETLENPADDGLGEGDVTSFLLSHCKSTGARVCEKKETLEVTANPPWATKLLATTPIRDEIPDAEFTLSCRNGAQEATVEELSGTLTPQVGDSVLEFASGSGELSDSADSHTATVSGTDKLKGPKKDTKITAVSP